MRRVIDLSLATLDRLAALVHGIYGAGKTDLVGDFLAYHAPHGAIKFISVGGEEGELSLSRHNLPLGVIEHADNYDDVLSLLDECRKNKVRAIGLDSLKFLSRASMAHTLGGERLPRTGQNLNEWGGVHFDAEQLIIRFRQSAPYVLATCSSDRSVNGVDRHVWVTPDLPGRQAMGAIGWFDLVGYMQSDIVGPGRVKRQLIVASNGDILTRQRLRRQIVDNIELPGSGSGGWAAVMAAVERAMKQETA